MAAIALIGSGITEATMADIDALYGQIVAGGTAKDLNPTDTALLLGRAHRASRSDSAEERSAGLRVAAAVGGRDGIEIVAVFARDADVGVRRETLRVAREARELGLPVLRDLAADADEAIAAESLELLLAVVDKASTRRARLLISSPSPRIRALAATLLGHVGGAAIRNEVQHLASDADESVRSAAAEALERLAGRLPKAAARPWWEDAGPIVPVPTAPEAPVEKPKAGPPPAIDAADLLRRMGRDAAEAPPAPLLADLRSVGDRALSGAFRAYRPGADPWLARGAALTAQHLGLASWAGDVRRLLSDPDPGVRAAAAVSLGTVGRGVSVLGALADRLADSDATVRVAAVRGLGALCNTLARPDLVAQRLDRVKTDPDESVRKARDEVLAAIRS